MSARPVLTAPEDALAPKTAHLLGRPLRRPDQNRARLPVAGRVVLITGAGGSIGHALVSAIAPLGPARLVLLDHAEYALWRTAQSLAAVAPGLPQHLVIANIRDAARLRRILVAETPDVVFHAAALKHLPMVQAHPLEGLLTNAIGTRHVLDAARAANCAAVILVSTDKAVAPTSIMGASKRLAELYAQALDIASVTRNAATRCLGLRLGNVLGSTGSIVELFQRQLSLGGPLTVTHPSMQRFFIADTEAAGFLLAAASLALARAVPPGAILVPEMGAPIRIVDLARRMIEAAGKVPGRDVGISVTGQRDGEKLAELPCHGGEALHPTAEADLRAVLPHTPELALLGRAFDELDSFCRAGEERLALARLSGLIPGFDPCPDMRADRLRA